MRELTLLTVLLTRELTLLTLRELTLLTALLTLDPADVGLWSEVG